MANDLNIGINNALTGNVQQLRDVQDAAAKGKTTLDLYTTSLLATGKAFAAVGVSASAYSTALKDLEKNQVVADEAIQATSTTASTYRAELQGLTELVGLLAKESGTSAAAILASKDAMQQFATIISTSNKFTETAIADVSGLIAAHEKLAATNQVVIGSYAGTAQAASDAEEQLLALSAGAESLESVYTRLAGIGATVSEGMVQQSAATANLIAVKERLSTLVNREVIDQQRLAEATEAAAQASRDQAEADATRRAEVEPYNDANRFATLGGVGDQAAIYNRLAGGAVAGANATSPVNVAALYAGANQRSLQQPGESAALAASYETLLAGAKPVDEEVEHLTTTTKEAMDAFDGASKSSAGFGRSLAGGFIVARLFREAVSGIVTIFGEWTVGAAQVAAKNDLLAAGLVGLSNANNVSVGAIFAQVEAIKQLGISTQDAQQGVARLVASQLDAGKASQLAALAQNAAVVSGTSISQAFVGILDGVASRQERVLRNYGIIVSFQDAFNRARAQEGRELTEFEKEQVALNEVMSKQNVLQGTFAAAAATAGGQLSLLSTRETEAKNVLGGEFQPVLSDAVSTLSKFYDWVSRNADILAKFAAVAAAAAIPVAAFIGATTLAFAGGAIASVGGGGAAGAALGGALTGIAGILAAPETIALIAVAAVAAAAYLVRNTGPDASLRQIAADAKTARQQVLSQTQPSGVSDSDFAAAREKSLKTIQDTEQERASLIYEQLQKPSFIEAIGSGLRDALLAGIKSLRPTSSQGSAEGGLAGAVLRSPLGILLSAANSVDRGIYGNTIGPLFNGLLSSPEQAAAGRKAQADAKFRAAGITIPDASKSGSVTQNPDAAEISKLQQINALAPAAVLTAQEALKRTVADYSVGLDKINQQHQIELDTLVKSGALEAGSVQKTKDQYELLSTIGAKYKELSRELLEQQRIKLAQLALDQQSTAVQGEKALSAISTNTQVERIQALPTSNLQSQLEVASQVAKIKANGAQKDLEAAYQSAAIDKQKADLEATRTKIVDGRVVTETDGNALAISAMAEINAQVKAEYDFRAAIYQIQSDTDKATIAALTAEAEKRQQIAEIARQTSVGVSTIGVQESAQSRTAAIETANTLLQADDKRLLSEKLSAGIQTATNVASIKASSDLYDANQKFIAAKIAAGSDEIKTASAVSDLTLSRLKIESDQRTAIDAAQLDAAQKLYAFQQQEMQQLRTQAGQLWDALIQNGATGLGDFVKQQIQGVGKTIFQNLAEQFFKKPQFTLPGQENADHSLTTLGKIFQGTPFGIDESQEALSLNTKGLALSTSVTSNLDDTNKQLVSVIQSLIGGTGGTGTGTGSGSNGGIGGTLNSITAAAGGVLGKVGGDVSGIVSTLATAGALGATVAAAHYANNESISVPLNPDLVAPLNTQQPSGMVILGGADNGQMAKIGGGSSAQPASRPSGGGAQFGKLSGTTGEKLQTGVAMAGSAIAAVGAFSQGGTGGALQGTGDVLMAIAPLTGPAAPFVAAAGMAINLIGGFFGTKQSARDARSKLIQDTLANRAFIAPPSINDIASPDGDFLGSDRFGKSRSSGDININIKSFDSKDVMSHSHDIASAVRSAIQVGHPVNSSIQGLTRM